MARTLEERLRDTLGALMFQMEVLQTRLDEAQEQLAKVQEELNELKKA